MSIISNRKNSVVITHDVANATYVVAGNNSVSNLCVNSTSNEVLSGASIRRVVWGTDGGFWTIKRGANTVMVLGGSNELRLDGMPLTAFKAANVVITLSTGTGFLMMELAKEGTFVSEY